jgi:hypothetical protein
VTWAIAHAEAYNVIVKKYGKWKTALGISWKEYLSEVANNPLTGEWARALGKVLDRLRVSSGC